MAADIFTRARELLWHPWWGFVAALIFAVWGGSKVTPTSSNLLLVLAWMIATVTAFNLGLIHDQPMIPRIFWTGVFSCVIGLSIYYWLWTMPKPVPGDIDLVKPTATPAFNVPQKIHDLFATDFRVFAYGATMQLKKPDTNDPVIPIECKVWQDFNSQAEFISIYVPACKDVVNAIASIPHIYKGILKDSESVLVKLKAPGDTSSVSSNDLKFTGMVYIYFEDELTLGQLGALDDLYRANGLTPQFRGHDYATAKWLTDMATPRKRTQ